MMMATSTLGLRVYDVLRAFDYLNTCREDTAGGTIALHGVDSGAAWAWYAAVLEPGFCALTVENLLSSYGDLAAARFYNSHLYGFRNLAYGLGNRFDLGDLLPALAPRPVRILTPQDPHGEPLDPETYRRRILEGQRAAARLPEGWEPEVGC